MAVAFVFASSTITESVPDQRTRHLPEASQNASPNLMPGTAATSASCRSSTLLMKCVCPRIKLMASGFSILRVVSSISASYDPANDQAAVATESAECSHDAINLGQRDRKSVG